MNKNKPFQRIRSGIFNSIFTVPYLPAVNNSINAVTDIHIVNKVSSDY
jgi:hypothetical protein